MEGMYNAGAGAVSLDLLQSKRKLASSFFTRGVVIALASGLCYGFYSTFLMLGMSTGIWGAWYGAETVLPAFAVTYMLGALGSAVNDMLSAIWAIIIAAIKGKLGDFVRTVKTKPGRMIAFAALAGGPVAGTAYTAYPAWYRNLLCCKFYDRKYRIGWRSSGRTGIRYGRCVRCSARLGN